VAVQVARGYVVPLIQRAVSPREPQLEDCDRILGYASCHAHIHGLRH